MVVQVKTYAFHVVLITMETFVKDSVQLSAKIMKLNARKPHQMDVLFLLYVTQNQLM